MEKLLAGVSGATNCAFVNQPGQGEALCGGCTAIALFNQANQALVLVVALKAVYVEEHL